MDYSFMLPAIIGMLILTTFLNHIIFNEFWRINMVFNLIWGITIIFYLVNKTGWYEVSPVVNKYLLKDFDFTIVTPSQWLADKVILSFLRAKDTHVIHNGIDTDIFKQNSDKKKLKQELRLPENKKIVLSVAVDIMSERKGGKHVVKLAELMKNDDTYFVLIGDN